MTDIFSLCIPTFNRFDTFLKNNLEKYLENPYINEIIITDENGNDYEKIKQHFHNEKIRVYKNDTILKAFKNKLKACSYAKNEWIVLMDSDNFADISYFEIAYNYIKNNKLDKNVILAPDFAFPNFNYNFLRNKIISKENIKEFYNIPKFDCFVNTGNYILNKYLIENLDLSKDLQINRLCTNPVDVLYMNILFFEQLDLKIHILENMMYQHIVHPGNFYTTECNLYHTEIQEINNRLKSFL
jgi:hypothetical protein